MAQGFCQSNHNKFIKKLKKQGCIVHSTVNQLFTLKVPIEKLQIAKELKGLSFLSISKKMNCALDKAVFVNYVMFFCMKINAVYFVRVVNYSIHIIHTLNHLKRNLMTKRLGKSDWKLAPWVSI